MFWRRADLRTETPAAGRGEKKKSKASRFGYPPGSEGEKEAAELAESGRALACRTTDKELKDFCTEVPFLGSSVPPTLLDLLGAAQECRRTVPGHDAPFWGLKSRGFEASRGVEAARQMPLKTRSDVK